MATNLNISENQERVPLRIGGGGLLRTISPDNGSPYYVGARAYVTQTAGGAIVTVIDKDGTTTATILNGTNGQNGVSITDVSLTSSSGNVDTYTITYSDGNTDTFTVTNGVDGANGQDGADGADGYSPTATVTKSGDTATITITDINGTTTATVKDGTQANAFTAEYGITTYADAKDAYDNDEILICTADDSGNTMVLQLVYFDATNEIFFFAEPNGDGLYWTELSNANGWDDGTRYLASTDVATQLADGLMSALDKQKLDTIASGAEVNVQSDWSQSDNTADDFIKSKPTIPSNVSDLLNDSGFITSPNVVYCTCSTAAGTAAKVATIVEGTLSSLTAGAQAIVKFTNANGKANPTLKIGDTEAKSIMRYGTTAPSTSAASSWNAGSCVLFTYDGTYWQMANYLNTTYSEISEANITNGSGSSSGLVTGRRAKKAVETFAPVKDVTVDGTSVLSGTTAAIDLSGKSDVGHTHTKSEITDFPTIHNVPSGGSSGQVLSKASGTDYDLAWVNQSGGGGGITDVEVDGTSVVTGGVAEIDLTGKSDVGHTHTTSAISDFPTNVSSFNNDSGYLVPIDLVENQVSALYFLSVNGSSATLVNSNGVAIGLLEFMVIYRGVAGLQIAQVLGGSGNNVEMRLYDVVKGDTVTASVRLVAVDSSTVYVADLQDTGNGLTGTFSTTSIPTLPTNVSAFTNDAGYITGYTETDPVFSASAASGISSSDISTWNGKSDFSGSYNDLTDKPTTVKTTFTPTGVTSYSGYGGCYYEKCGSVVHVHVGVSGLTAGGTDHNIFTLPSGYRPTTQVHAHGTGGNWNNLGYLYIGDDGAIHVRSAGAYCGADITYLV